MNNNIKTLRKQKKLSQRELAKKLNISNSTISLLESNKRHGNIQTLKKIADYFKVPLEQLYD